MLKQYYTVGQLRNGLEQLSRPRRAAILFGLDSDIDLYKIVTLTWADAKKPELRWKMNSFAKSILSDQPRHISSPYVFWSFKEASPMPLFGLEQDVFDAFGMTWQELRLAYKNMIWIDEEIEAQFWKDNALQICSA